MVWVDIFFVFESPLENHFKKLPTKQLHNHNKKLLKYRLKKSKCSNKQTKSNFTYQMKCRPSRRSRIKLVSPSECKRTTSSDGVHFVHQFIDYAEFSIPPKPWELIRVYYFCMRSSIKFVSCVTKHCIFMYQQYSNKMKVVLWKEFSCLFHFFQQYKYMSAIAVKNVLYIPVTKGNILHFAWHSIFLSFNNLLLFYLDLEYITLRFTWPCLLVYIRILFLFYMSVWFYVCYPLELQLPSLFIIKLVPYQPVPVRLFTPPGDLLDDPLPAAQPAHPARCLNLPVLLPTSANWPLTIFSTEISI